MQRHVVFPVEPLIPKSADSIFSIVSKQDLVSFWVSLDTIYVNKICEINKNIELIAIISIT